MSTFVDLIFLDSFGSRVSFWDNQFLASLVKVDSWYFLSILRKCTLTKLQLLKSSSFKFVCISPILHTLSIWEMFGNNTHRLKKDNSMTLLTKKKNTTEISLITSSTRTCDICSSTPPETTMKHKRQLGLGSFIAPTIDITEEMKSERRSCYIGYIGVFCTRKSGRSDV